MKSRQQKTLHWLTRTDINKILVKVKGQVYRTVPKPAMLCVTETPPLKKYNI